MNNFIRFLFNSSDLELIDNYNYLKELIINHAKKDYLFFPFLIGYVERFLNESNESLSLKDMTLITIFDLLKVNRITVYFVSSKEMELVRWETEDELNSVLERIKTEWDNCGDKEPESNQVIWITA